MEHAHDSRVPHAGRNGGQSVTGRGRRSLRRALLLLVLVLASASLLVAGALLHEQILGWIRPVEPADGTGGQVADKQQLWTCGMHPQVIQDKPGICPICHMKLEPLDMVQSGGSKMGAPDDGQRKIKYWWDPMLGPSSISDKPGKSTMGMDLVPVYEDEVSAGPRVAIDPVVVQNMGVRVAPVMRGLVERTIRGVGYLEEAQPRIHDVNLRVSGWIEKLHADIEGQYIRAGDPLFELYSPDVQVAIQELLIAGEAAPAAEVSSAARVHDQTLLEAARLKLEQFGLTQEQIEQFTKLARVPRTITFLSPITGYVTEKSVVEGAAVESGERVLRIVDYSVLWLDAQVYEQDLAFVKLGQKFTAEVDALPRETFSGEVIFLHPKVDPVTRTATVRMTLPNPRLRLRPGMYATAYITAQLADDALLAPREAIIDTGTRKVVFVSVGEGRFEPRNVKTGALASEGGVEILSGLVHNEMVVISGQFLLDAESRMKEAIQKHLEQSLLAKGGKAKAPATAPTTREMESPASIPTGESAPGSEGVKTRVAWTPDVDNIYKAYLEMGRTLGEPRQIEASIGMTSLVQAAKALTKATPPPGQRLPENVLKAATAMEGKPAAEQRKLFKVLSEAVIAMAEVCPPSRALGDKLYVAYCPMAFGTGASWLQAEKSIANPYYATEMKQCGEIKRTLESAQDKR